MTRERLSKRESYQEYPELGYVRKNQKLLERFYPGKWICVVGDVIISSGRSPEQALKRSIKSTDRPFLYYVSSPNDPMLLPTILVDTSKT